MKLKFTSICALIILLSPTLSHAFVSDTEQVTRLTDDVWLSVNTAEYGNSEDRDSGKPATPKTGTSENPVTPKTGPSWNPEFYTNH
jgi:hypothetical protein